ncbi:MAG: toxin-antitoxin system HicB family antitoxin [candidate division KSB1 bacterium]|nr:toxin-antitoxin system HicB family antitoxin [candidate division KSB1 bacterium]
MQYQHSNAFRAESDMRQITLRNIDPDLLKKIKELAQKENLSMNKFIIKILKQALLTAEKKNIPGQIPHHDLDELAGTWSEQEAQAFERALKQQRQIDEELWS